MTISWHNITIYHVGLPLKEAFVTSQQTINTRQLLILSATITLDGQKVTGIGEVQSFEVPFYTDEILADDLTVLQQLWPALRSQTFEDLTSFVGWLSDKLPYQPFLRAALEMIIWNARTKLMHTSISELIGGVTRSVPMGIALGVSQSFATKVENAYTQGYRRIKIKTPPDTDFSKLKSVILSFPNIRFSIDANMSWHALSLKQLREIDELGLRLVEQPFGRMEWSEHKNLQKIWKNTDVSLDESIQSLSDLEYALKDNIANAFTIKQGMLGGLSAAISAIEAIHNAGKLAWIGGMLSSNIGRAFDISLASLPGMNDFPGDISNSDHYFLEDITTHDFVGQNGQMDVPDFLLELNHDALMSHVILTKKLD